MELKDKLIKAYEKRPLHELPKAPVFALQGLSKKDAAWLEKAFYVRTIEDLAGLKFALWARELSDLAESGGKVSPSKYKDKVIKKYEKKTPAELVKAPVFALQGLSKKDGERLYKAFKTKTVGDLARLKFYRWAVEITEAGKKPAARKGDKSFYKTALKLIIAACVLIFIAVLIRNFYNPVKEFIKGKLKTSVRIQEAQKAESIPEIKVIEKEKAPEGKVYVVEVKDQLTEISKKFYGNFADWKLIYEANKGTIKNPHIIFPGQRLIIPEKKIP